MSKNKPVVIDMPTNPARLVLTDGFHISPPIDLQYTPRYTRFYKVACVIEDDQLLFGAVIVFLMYAMGATSGMYVLQLLSVLPVLYFLFLYYIRRKEFIQLRPA